MTADLPSTDPVLARRARIATAVVLGKRIGYSILLAAVIAFVVGYSVGFSAWLVTAIVASLIVSSVILAPAIVLGYGVRAADREDRESAERQRGGA